MKEILNAYRANEVLDMAGGASANDFKNSPFRDTGNLSFSLRSAQSHGVFSPHVSHGSPMEPSSKKSKLTLSTSSLRLGGNHNHHNQHNRSATGIAASLSPQRLSHTTTLNGPGSVSAPFSSYSTMDRSMNRSRLMMSSTALLSTMNVNTPHQHQHHLHQHNPFYETFPPIGVGAGIGMGQHQQMDPTEAKHLYFAHYNGLEVSV